MAIENPTYPIFNGYLFFDEHDANGNPTGGIKLGNFILNIKTNSEKKELASNEIDTAGSAIDTHYMNKPMGVTLEGEGLTSSLLALGVGGVVVDGSVVGATVAAESHTIKTLDRSLKLTYGEVSVLAIAKSTDAEKTDVAAVVSTGVFTKASHGYANGDFIILTYSDTLTNAENTPFKITDSAANTFKLATAADVAITLVGEDASAITVRKVLNPDSYVIENARLGLVTPLSTGTTSLAVDDVLEVYYSYASKTFKQVNSGSKASKAGTLYGEMEDVQTGQRALVTLPKIALISDSELRFISQDYTKLTLTGTPIALPGRDAVEIEWDIR